MDKIIIYHNTPLKKAGFFCRILGKQLKDNAYIEINNILAENILRDITIEDVQNILFKYKIPIYSISLSNISELYTKYLFHCFSDGILTEDEINNLKHLKDILHLSDTSIQEIHNKLATEIYKTEFEKAIADGKITDEEKLFLSKLQNNIKLSDDLINNIHQESTSKYLNSIINNAVSDKRLSPDEEKELQAIAHNLNAKLQIDQNTQATLDKYRLFWQIENSDIPIISVPINLQKTEKCYFHTQINWLEERRITKRINYSGPTLRIKIVKGLYWRTGSLNVQKISEDIWTKIDNGQIYLTNKRLIFMGAKGNKSISLNKILDYTAYKNGIDIQKESGKSPFLQFDNNIDLFAIFLGRAISEC